MPSRSLIINGIVPQLSFTNFAVTVSSLCFTMSFMQKWRQGEDDEACREDAWEQYHRVLARFVEYQKRKAFLS